MTEAAAPGGPDDAAAKAAAGDVVPLHDLRGLLRLVSFRRLWISLGFSSLGDWLGFLATTALAASYGGGNYALANLAVGAVLVLRMLPALVLGPIAGAVVDRFDRRRTMVVCDVIRFGAYASIPVVGTWWWLFAATLIAECAAIFWAPAKEASVPNLVPRERLEAANQLGLITTYGSAPVAAAIFTVLATFSSLLGRAALPALAANPVDVALYVNALTYLFAAWTVFRLRDIPPPGGADAATPPSVLRQITEGWAFVGRTPLIRGLVLGMLGAFAAGGAVIGVARVFVGSLHAGDAGYGLLFGAIFVGMAAGMGAGPRVLRGFSRKRAFGLALVAAGLVLVAIALIANLVVAIVLTVVLGAFAGVAWVIGYTLVGLEVDDALRGRTFAFLQTMVRIVLIAVLALAPLIAAAVGAHEFRVSVFLMHFDGSNAVLLIAAVLLLALGGVSYRQMDDRRGVPVVSDLVGAATGDLVAPAPRRSEPGVFVAFEGGEGAGKSTQVGLLGDRLRAEGYDVVLTREPGATAVGGRLRELLLDPATGDLDPRTEAMLYAADRAEHVAAVVRPALHRGAVVLSDRYVDSSRAYQGAGRELTEDDVARLSAWATEGLRPDLTVVLDIAPAAGAARFTAAPDRLEQEPVAFHDRVRQAFLTYAAEDPGRYLVVDAAEAPELVAEQILARLQPLLPPVPGEASGTRAQDSAGRSSS